MVETYNNVETLLSQNIYMLHIVTYMDSDLVIKRVRKNAKGLNLSQFSIASLFADCELGVTCEAGSGLSEAEAVLISFANLLLQLTPHTRHQRVFASIPSGTWLSVEPK